MKAKNIVEKSREMTPLELQAKLKESKEELFNLRFQLATGHLDDYSRIRQLKKQIARLQTVVRERELGLRS
ncbi:MAG: 50S ribosomal protein L29 [Firmicutes bacterium]|nr:50S ribosomal protein L29 [Bacillota bacterium]